MPSSTIPRVSGPLRRSTRITAPAALCAALAGCATSQARIEALEATTPWHAMPLTEVWSHQPTAIAAFGRDLGPQSEQRVGLRNDTAAPGDNLLLMRAHRAGSPIVAVPSIEEFLRRSGGAPAPFEADFEGRLNLDADRAGPFVWAERTVEGGTLCVVAMRRVQRDAALLEPGIEALDVMLRNCVDGPVDEALAPISLRRIAMANAGGDAAPSRAISHLAGPRAATRPMGTAP